MNTIYSKSDLAHITVTGLGNFMLVCDFCTISLL